MPGVTGPAGRIGVMACDDGGDGGSVGAGVVVRVVGFAGMDSGGGAAWG